MKHKVLIITLITLVAITTLTCKADLSSELEKALKEAKDAKQIVLEAQAVRANAELNAIIKEIEAEAEMEAQKITEIEAALATTITQEKQKTAESAITKQETAKQEIQQTQDEILKAKIQVIKIAIELNQNSRQIIINKLKSKVEDNATILNMHTDTNWHEPSDHFGMTSLPGQQRNISAFNRASKKYDQKGYETYPYLLESNQAAKDRRKIYLSFKYDKISIQKYGEIFNRLIDAGTHLAVEDILNVTIDYANAYFEVALMTLRNKQDKLTSLSLARLKELHNTFERLETEKQSFENCMKTLYNDYHNNNYNIKDGNYKNIIAYMSANKYKERLTTTANTITSLANQLKNLLDQI
ncbi:virulence associated lipoprotein [Borrelia hermsii]|uniref:virulence associated lipoprotein n=1 Tax=Borrelia hermsii TaxID=140 RepID=UPI00046CBC93|nr:virulence associated lipoprotein [Borrelia hermsii]